MREGGFGKGNGRRVAGLAKKRKKKENTGKHKNAKKGLGGRGGGCVCEVLGGKLRGEEGN